MPEEFIKTYEAALATQNWMHIAPLISSNAAVTFSNGTVHKGVPKIRSAFERNFEIIKNEKYTISNVRWLKKEKTYAVYLFDFSWVGIINHKKVAGNGIGTSVIIKEQGSWKLLSEHLGKKA